MGLAVEVLQLQVQRSGALQEISPCSELMSISVTILRHPETTGLFLNSF